jgi:hypothetical protein
MRLGARRVGPRLRRVEAGIGRLTALVPGGAAIDGFATGMKKDVDGRPSPAMTVRV